MKDESGPAFPVPRRFDAEDGEEIPTHPGMTLRDWFAGQAMASMQPALPVPHGHETQLHVAVVRAHWAYLLADAMLAERRQHIPAIPPPPKGRPSNI